MAKKKKIVRIPNIKIKRSIKELGHLFFGLGLALVILFTITNPPSTLKPFHGILLLSIGLIVGLMDVKQDQTVPFLLAFLGLLLTASAPLQVLTYKNVGLYLKSFLVNMAIFLTLAVVAVSLKVIFKIYKKSNI